MSYSIDARKLVLKYRDNGHTLEETHKEFGISITTLCDWEKIRSQTGSLGGKKLTRTARKFHEKELKELVEKNTDITLEKVAKHFKGSVSGAFDACERYKITLKKRDIL